MTLSCFGELSSVYAEVWFSSSFQCFGKDTLLISFWPTDAPKGNNSKILRSGHLNYILI